MTTIKLGDKVIRDIATVNHGKVHLGDYAPLFVRAGDKVAQDVATVNNGNVRLGDYAPVFVRAGDKVVRDAATHNIRVGWRVGRAAARPYY